MVRNPQWSKTVGRYGAPTSAAWCATPSEASHMNIAILYDAEAVAGDADLLRAVKADLIAAMRGERARLAHFARAIDQFPTPIGLFNYAAGTRDGEAMDLKKGGIFPIVHGVRSLALERGLEETNTARADRPAGRTRRLAGGFCARADAGALLSDDDDARRPARA